MEAVVSEDIQTREAEEFPWLEDLDRAIAEIEDQNRIWDRLEAPKDRDNDIRRIGQQQWNRLPGWLTAGIEVDFSKPLPSVNELLEKQGRIVRLDAVWKTGYKQLRDALTNSQNRGKSLSHQQIIDSGLLGGIQLDQGKNELYKDKNYWLGEIDDTDVESSRYLVLASVDKANPRGWYLVQPKPNPDSKKKGVHAQRLFIEIKPTYDRT